MSDAPALRLDASDWLAEPGLAAVLAALPRARLAGGAVRDLIAGMPLADVDLATPDPPDAVIAALRGAGLKAVPTGIAHGTITAVSHGRGFEVTTLRRDIETDGRHATVAFSDDWREDAARRDFTINAMSMDPSGAVYDYFGGIADLRAGHLRFVGDPARRIAEDYLRVLRFFRFHARYAAGKPDAATEAALRESVPGLARLSAERVWSELKRILGAPDPRPSLTLMHAFGVLGAVLPEAVFPEAAPASRLDPLFATGAAADPLLRLAALIGPQAPSPAARLRLSTAEAERLAALRGGPTPAAEDDDAALRRMLADTAKPILLDRLYLAGAPESLRKRVAAMKVPQFPVKGRDALNAGGSSGPALGVALARTRAWWIASGCTHDRAACLAHLAEELEHDRSAMSLHRPAPPPGYP